MDCSISGTTATLAVGAVSGTNASDVTASDGDLAGLNGMVTPDFAGGQDIKDTSGNALTNTAPAGSNNSFAVANTLSPPPLPTTPTVTISVDPSPITEGAVAAFTVRHRAPDRPADGEGDHRGWAGLRGNRPGKTQDDDHSSRHRPLHCTHSERPRSTIAMANQLPTDRTALVTGASRGIGRAVALELAAAGVEVVVNYARSPEAAAQVVATIKERGGRAYGLQADVSNETEADGLVKAVLERSGNLDVLVNNAGITRDGLLMRMKTADWQAVIDLNLSGVFYCTRAVTRPMLKQKRGRIVNITSVVGLMGNPGQANYGAAKAGVIGLTRTSAKELASRGITVNAVAPGFIATDMTSGLESDDLLKAIPMGCFGQPEHVAGAVRFLAADPAAAYITGQVLQVDGGIY